MITVVIPARINVPRDGGSISSNLGKGSTCTLTLAEDDPEPTRPPAMNGSTCDVQRIPRERVDAGAFRGWTIAP